MKETAKSLLKGATWKKAAFEQKSSWGETIAQSVTDVGLGLTGSLIGSYLRVVAVPAGVVLNVVANKNGYRWLRSASIGMMTAPLDEELGINSKTAKGAGFNLKDEMQTSKEHMKMYAAQLKKKFFLDKIFKGKDDSSSTSNSSTSDSSTTDNSTVSGWEEVDPSSFAELEAFEQQVISKAVEQQAGKKQSFATSDTAKKSDVFSIAGLDDLNTPHVI